jgi:biotin carboxyl carrier protein
MATMSSPSRAIRVSPSPSSGHAGEGSVVLEPGRPGLGGHAILRGDLGPPDRDGRRTIEVVADGWRFEFVVEDEGLARLRERATRDRGGAATAGGSLEIRAIIPGRVASIAVTPGDVVELGQTLLAVEAMKMQNELRAPRAGTVVSVPATAGSTVDVGDILVVLG